MNPPDKEQLEDWDRRHVWHPFTPMQAWADERPLIVAEARGCTLIDLDGREYVDGVSSLWCNVHGHRVPQIDQAVREQLDRVAHTTLLGLGSVPSIVLAKRLVDLAPPGLTRVFFSDDGATAVEVALKMAFQYWRQCEPPRPQKTRFLALTAAYHGDTIGDVSVGDLGRFHHLFAPLLFPTIKAPSPYCYRCPLGLQRANGWAPFVSMQPHYNLMYREEEREMLPLCRSEGIGVIPHEIVEYDPRHLEASRDTLILRAEELLAKFPKGKVPYDPSSFGWTQ